MENKTEQERKLLEKNLQGRRVWLYKPGEQGSKWGLMCELGLMGIGWSKLGDLSHYTREQIKPKLDEFYPLDEDGSRKNDVTTLYNFANEIKIGDMVLAMKGTTKILGYGEVKSDYFYDTSKDSDTIDKFCSFREVEWTKKELDTGRWARKTLTNITTYKETQDVLVCLLDMGFVKQIKDTKIPLNQILYGPPGTGKTYHTIDKALEILFAWKEIDFIPQERDEKKKIFNDFISDEQIGFVTFHQSYGYEDFVEGIRPRLSGENDESQISEKMEYEIKDGIFKSMCKEASKNYEKSQKDSSEVKQEIELDDLLEQYATYIEDELKEGKEPKFESKEWTSKMKIQGVHRLQNGDFSSIVIGTNKDSGVMQRLTQKVIKRDYEKFKSGEIKDWNDIKPSYESKSHRHGNAGYYFTLYESIAEFEKEHYKPSTIPTLESTLDNRLKPYILIIDEINRGNISKILGELITLLEPSKRKGESEALEVKLPYSQEPFSVPNNLYIIGTMNTADRSIALLDTALRRRFEFIEMMPNPSELEKISCDDGEIDLKELLKAMNNRIEFLLDRERTIGHSFFFEKAVNKGNDSYGLTLTDLKAVFKNKILPLLQEYFYDDYAKINAVLNNNGMLESKTINNMKSLDEFVDSEKKVWKITDSSKWDIETFKAMYKNIESN
ncbi:AAA family ATPase [Helicobacter canis]|uniref:AAA family ATPase n=1 Tax=Helicobacter canis TaxID=29419 RepID=UPI002943439F|nr:AAA family ATPase [Helicobacter canis]